MASGGIPKSGAVLDSIVAVFKVSALKELVGTDALRSVLSGQYRDLVVKKELHLQVIWDLLADQPGFDGQKALPPFCQIKVWLAELMPVHMPQELLGMRDSEIKRAAALCPVADKHKYAALHPEEAAAEAKEQEKLSISHSHTTDSILVVNEPSTRRPMLEAGLAIVAVFGLGFGGYTLSGYFAGPAFETMSVTGLDTNLPVDSARRLGRDYNVVISDPNWFNLPAEEREESMRETLQLLQSDNVEVLVVTDTSGALRASAQWVGTPSKISVRFQ